MTHETKVFIDFADILSVQLECVKCGTRYVRPIDKAGHLPMYCPTCGIGTEGAEWFTGNQDSDRVALVAFLNQLQKLNSDFIKSLAQKKLRVMLEIKPSASQKSEREP